MGQRHGPRARRGEALYAEDKSLAKRRSHENVSVGRLYEKYLKKPNSEKSAPSSPYPLQPSQQGGWESSQRRIAPEERKEPP